MAIYCIVAPNLTALGLIGGNLSVRPQTRLSAAFTYVYVKRHILASGVLTLFVEVRIQLEYIAQMNGVRSK